MLPPSPPSPPSGPPRGTNFSRRKLTQPRPPFPASTLISASSMNFMTRHSRARNEKAPRCGAHRCATDVLRLFSDDVDYAATFDALDSELDAPRGARVQRVIAAHAHVRAGVIIRAALPDDDVAGE